MDTNSKKQIKYEDCLEIIKKLRFNEESDIFAIERNKGLESIIGSIYQTFDGSDVYKSIEEKAANFLYMVVKNHVFIDGNKRIAATLFIYFLKRVLSVFITFRHEKKSFTANLIPQTA